MVDLEKVSPVGRQMILELRERRALDKRVVVSTADAMLLLGMKETRIREFMAGPKPRFPSITDGRMRRLWVGPLYDYLEERVAACHPAKGAAA